MVASEVPFIPNKKDVACPSKARALPWVFIKRNPDLARRVLTGLGGSMFMNKRQKSLVKDQRKQQLALDRAKQKLEAEQQKAESSAGEVGPKKKARLEKMEDQVAAAEESMSISSSDRTMESLVTAGILTRNGVAEDGSGSRPKLWLDDVVIMAQQAAKGKLGEMPETFHLVSLCISISLEFCFTGSVAIDNAKHTQWTTLRCTLLGFLVKAIDGPINGGAVKDVAKHIKLTTALLSADLGLGYSSEFQAVGNGVLDFTALEKFFGTNNCKLPATTHATYSGIMTTMLSTCSCGGVAAAPTAESCPLHKKLGLDDVIEMLLGTHLLLHIFIDPLHHVARLTKTASVASQCCNVLSIASEAHVVCSREYYFVASRCNCQCAAS